MANPPVCRIMDYGKFRYEESQKAKESRKKTIQVSIKEVKFRPKIGKGDFDTKVRHMQDFLEDGHKVKVTLQFRGREMAHPELGSRILDAVIEQIGTHGKVETMARLEGRNMTMVLAPEKKAVIKKPHEPRVHEDKHEQDPKADETAADDAPATAQPPEQVVEAPEVQAPEVQAPEVQAPEVQAPAEPVAEAVVETVDPA
jgi:translation initiation factor IF-3